MKLRTILAGFVLCSVAPMPGFAGYTDPAVSVVVGSASTPTVNQPIIVYAGGNTSVILTATATNFTPTSYTWTQVPDVSNKFATAGTATFTTLQSGNKAVKATLSAKGVYQFQVTATDGTNQASRYAWVNVWDSVPALAGNDIIGRNPGVIPPDQVRVCRRIPGRSVIHASSSPARIGRNSTRRISPPVALTPRRMPAFPPRHWWQVCETISTKRATRSTASRKRSSLMQTADTRTPA